MFTQAIKMRRLNRNFKAVAAMAGVSALLLVASSGLGLAQADPCQAKADYESAKKAAEAAQVEFDKQKLSRSVESILVRDPTDAAEKLPDQKVEEIIANMRRSLQRYEKRPEKERRGFENAFAHVAQQLAELEAWLNARKKRDEADRNLEAAKQPYIRAINAKDEALKNARATFDKEQAHIRRVRARLEGRPQDDAYKREVTELLTRTRAAYERMLDYLGMFDCFVDVRNFMDNLRERIRKIDANVDIVRDFDPTSPMSESSSSSPPVADADDLTKGGLSKKIAGLWLDSETGSVIEIRADGTGVLNVVGESSGRRGYKRGDLHLTGIRLVGGNTLEAMLTTRAPKDTCPTLGPTPVKASIKVDSGGNSLSLTAPSMEWALTAGGPCRWTGRVYEIMNVTLSRVQ